MSKNSWEKSKIIGPDPTNEQLTASVSAINHLGEASDISVVTEKPLTIYLNSQEIVTAMTIGDYPSLLALGYLKTKGCLNKQTNLEPSYC